MHLLVSQQVHQYIAIWLGILHGQLTRVFVSIVDELRKGTKDVRAYYPETVTSIPIFQVEQALLLALKDSACVASVSMIEPQMRKIKVADTLIGDWISLNSLFD